MNRVKSLIPWLLIPGMVSCATFLTPSQLGLGSGSGLVATDGKAFSVVQPIPGPVGPQGPAGPPGPPGTGSAPSVTQYKVSSTSANAYPCSDTTKNPYAVFRMGIRQYNSAAEDYTVVNGSVVFNNNPRTLPQAGDNIVLDCY